MQSMWIYLILLVAMVVTVTAEKWPVPYKRLPARPPNNPWCEALYPFCPTGLTPYTMPQFDQDEIIDVFALKAPVWEFKYGSLMKIFNIMHDAIGFRSQRSGLNYTMEWYELYQLGNCTFPHVLRGQELRWCNQGATCIYPSIDDRHWAENGTLVKVAEMNGTQFKQFSEWALWDNRTGVFYETWSVLEETDGQHWFDSHDCATFVLNSFQRLGELEVKFNQSIKLPYTRINMYSERPLNIGNISDIKTNYPGIYLDMLHFYSFFQPHRPLLETLIHAVEALYETMVRKKFYFFYNEEYWLLRLKYPYIKLTNNIILLP